MNEMVFDEKVAAALEVVYGTRDVVHRRNLVYEALAAEPGEDVLDIGCGLGFYVAEILDRVGETGSVTGVDAAAPMLAIAQRRVAGRKGATLLEGEATALPVGDGSFDAAVSVQVLEYVADLPAALAEIQRVLRPGGRVVLWDVDWSTLSWHSSDPARMERMLAAWDRHLVHPALPRTLAAELGRAGFSDVRRGAHVFATTALDPQTYGGQLGATVRHYLRGLDDVDQGEADAWLADLGALHDRGEYSCAVTQFCFTATR